MYIVMQNGLYYNTHESGYLNKQDTNKGNKNKKKENSRNTIKGNRTKLVTI